MTTLLVHADRDDLATARRWGTLEVVGAQGLRQRCDGHCSQPHWGYVIGGVLRVAYPDHDEVIGAGQAYYVAPGHLRLELGNTELVDFSPAERSSTDDDSG